MSGDSAQRVGEHFVLGFRGLSLPRWLIDFECEFGLGGVLLFDRDLAARTDVRNVESKAQVRALCAEVHALPSRPLVFVDQEGGLVRRLKPKHGFSELPSHADFARLPAARARELAAASCAELAACGIDFDLAPVVDLDTNPDNPNIGALGRSFSADPVEVARCVRIFAAAAREAGLRLCLKHYPGLGGARVDSHLERTDVTGTLTPEQEALFVGLVGEIPGGAVLLSHALDRERDPEWPAAISEVHVAALREARPDALLITDDVQMKGLRDLCDTSEAARRALRAGVDWVCIGNNLAQEEAECAASAAALRVAAADDALLAARLGESRARIDAAKRAAAEP